MWFSDSSKIIKETEKERRYSASLSVRTVKQANDSRISDKMRFYLQLCELLLLAGELCYFLPFIFRILQNPPPPPLFPTSHQKCGSGEFWSGCMIKLQVWGTLIKSQGSEWWNRDAVSRLTWPLSLPITSPSTSENEVGGVGRVLLKELSTLASP